MCGVGELELGLVLLVLVSYAGGENYCARGLCPKGITHIGCNNNEAFGSSCPTNATLIPLTQKDKDSMVQIHNTLRNKWASGQGKIQRKACKMGTMDWDEELARLAELNVKSCQMEHDSCHNTQEFLQSGQNLFMVGYFGSGDPVTVQDILNEGFNEWTDEDVAVTEEDFNKFPDPVEGQEIGHFMVLINEKNVAVGCAIVSFYLDDIEYFLVACNYAVTNILGRRVYSSCPEAGIQCPNGLDAKYTALCV
ncbi:antigen 5 like allergen Cul n 1 [Drosophila bipectinata]|uniref:antigen 5 like allergen Cul n 1 n=1 Tax=Drosophila bipectinata TaxID=42026 RepID=UPI001C896D4D|nr:antigen 5 like allergen Cul n 1 [Drosophila bipectinata]